METNRIVSRRFSDPIREKQNCKLMREEMTSDKEKYNILCLDGGGTRGIIQCAILDEVERVTGKYLHELFDFVCGVSTSALLATAVGFHGKAVLVKEVFSQVAISRFQTGQLGRISSYNDEKLKKELMAEFGTHVMYDPSSCLNPTLKLCILAAEFNPQKSYQAVFFRNYNAQKENRSSIFNNATFLDAVMSSFCSPIHLTFQKIKNTVFYDGGIICNNPTLEAIMEARQVFGMNKQFTVLSIGTGTLDTITSQGLNGNITESYVKYWEGCTRPMGNNSKSVNSSSIFSWDWFASTSEDTSEVPIAQNITKFMDGIGNSDAIADSVNRYIASSCVGGQIDYFRFSPPGLGVYKLSNSNKKTYDVLYAKAKEYIRQNSDQFNTMCDSLLKASHNTK